MSLLFLGGCPTICRELCYMGVGVLSLCYLTPAQWFAYLPHLGMRFYYLLPIDLASETVLLVYVSELYKL